MEKKFPIEEVRKLFPALNRMHNGRQVVYFDGPGGSQFLESAITAISDYMKNGAANLHGNFPTSHETEALIQKAKEDIAVLFNAQASEIAFGPNATTMMFHTSRALAKQWQAGDEIILTELEHHSNIDSWRRAAEDRGVLVKYIPLNTKTLELEIDKLDELISQKTKLIAVGHASNCVGTITDIKAISEKAKKVGALVAVDSVHSIPHIYVDMQELGIDMLFSSAYKFFASHVGMAVIQKKLFDSLDIYKVVPAPNGVPDRLEIGTQNHEGIPAVSEAIYFIASLGEGKTLKEQLISGYHAIEQYENMLAERIRVGLSEIPNIRLYQSEGRKTPTIAFRAEGIAPVDFCTRMCEEHSVFIAEGHFYALTLVERLGIDQTGGFIRAGVAPYNTIEEVYRFLNGVKQILA